MNESLNLALSFLAGAAVGVFFFGGLWWTVKKGISSRRPALLFLGSFVVRMGVALAVFYYVSGGQWPRLAVCLLGFLLARSLATRLTGASTVKKTGLLKGAEDANHS